MRTRYTPEQIRDILADVYNEDHQATYCPEDDKIRLYVGRVPREEYEVLRELGFQSTPKQGCDFAAVWSPNREFAALAYTGLLLDEDQSPAERAADRAERFSEYREKRRAEASDYADEYDAGPVAHGYQNQAKAERAAARHDRKADYAVDAWSKAEYWQRRTAGVIAHALHLAAPSVRMGRIKKLESEIRNRPEGSKWRAHCELRLAYERQMMEAAGGRAGELEMQKGGTFKGGVIAKVNKSNATGRVVSVAVIVPAVEGWAYRIANEPGTSFALMQCEVERAAPGAYKEPTPESLAKLEEFEKARKEAQAKKPAAPPLINPDRESAERLQAIYNAETVRRWERAHGGKKISENLPSYYVLPEQPEPWEMTQAEYKARSAGSFNAAKTVYIGPDGKETHRQYYGNTAEGAAFKVRTVGYDPRRVIILTDKPQKPLPAFLEKEAPEVEPEKVTA